MRCLARVRREGGVIVARCVEFPSCEGKGATEAEAVARLRDSVLFWLEACPCDQTAGPGLEFRVVRDESLQR
jgi:hypothetical protein